MTTPSTPSTPSVPHPVDTNREALAEIFDKMTVLENQRIELFNKMFQDVTPSTSLEKTKMAIATKAKYSAHKCNVGDFLQTRSAIYLRIK